MISSSNYRQRRGRRNRSPVSVSRQPPPLTLVPSPSREDKKRHSHRPSQLECFCVPASPLQPVRSVHSQRAGVQGRLFKKSALDLLIEPLLADTPYPVHQAEIDPTGRWRSIERVITFPAFYGLGSRHSGFELSCLPTRKKRKELLMD